ncbi:MAG: 30S ribosomal protein S27e [Candidatus Kariarchaeaceae archaeon]|jgi:small subunit ribosomal protein S27e
MELVPQPNTKFVKVKCSECETETIVFNHAKTVVNCSSESCNEVLAQPRSGKAEIVGEIIEIYE